MLKQTITYEDIDEQPAQATLYFNLNQLEIAKDMELEKLEARFLKFQDEVINDGERKMTQPEIRELYQMIEVLVKASYGKRYGEDNKLFSKKPEVWDEFNDSGQYDGFMRWLFDDNGARANSFFENIWPRMLRDAYQKDQRNLQAVPEIKLPESNNVGTEAPVAPDDSVQSITSLMEERSLGSYPDDELLAMNDTEWNAFLEKHRQGNNIPGRLLVLGFQRNKEGTTE